LKEIAYTIWDCAREICNFLKENFGSDEFRKYFNLNTNTKILEMGAGTGWKFQNFKIQIMH